MLPEIPRLGRPVNCLSNPLSTKATETPNGRLAPLTGIPRFADSYRGVSESTSETLVAVALPPASASIVQTIMGTIITNEL